jgi:integral membrane protein
MKKMLENPVGRLRLLGIAEGLSLLILLCIAMPLKYMADQPEAVKYTGWIHGILFVGYVVAVLVMFYERNWPFRKVVLACLAAFLPFGTFVFDAQLREEEQAGRVKQ